MIRPSLFLALALTATGCGDDGGADGGRDSGGRDAGPGNDGAVPTDAGSDAIGPPPFDAGCSMPTDLPQIVCPEDISVCVGMAGMTIDFMPAAFNCDGTTLTAECTPRSGIVYMPGNYTVNCIARNEAGEASCSFNIEALGQTTASLMCAAPVMQGCTGPLTPVTIADPTVAAGCDSMVGAITSDAPAGGYPVGTTTVTYGADSASGRINCTTNVSITDTAPPMVSCPASQVIVRAGPGEPIGPFTATGSDVCDSSVMVTVTGAPSGRGMSTATATATDDAGLTASCMFSVQVVDAFTVEGFRLANATRTGGSTAVAFVWEPSGGLDTTGYLLERATDSAGPYTSVMTVAAGTLIGRDTVPGTRAYYRLVTMAGTRRGGVTDPIEVYAVDQDQYDLRGQSVPGIPFATTLYGVVRHPTDLTRGPYPLILVIHGNHGICRVGPTSDACATTTDGICPSGPTTPNAEGYIYFLETLAAQGYIAMSMSANALNCRGDFIPERTQLVLEHIRRWRTWHMTGAAPFPTKFMGRVDLARVGVVGHSRGGEAVEAVPSALRSTPITGVTVRSVFAIAPVDFHDPTVVGTPFAVLLPGCDGDVSTLEGRDCYDRSVAPAETTERAQVLMARANHNFYNSQWLNDDNGGGFACPVGSTVGAAAQRGMLEITLSSWLNATVRDAAIEPFIRMETDTPRGMDAWSGVDLDLRWSYASPMRRLIDEYEGAGTPFTNLLGQPNTYSGYDGSVTTRCFGTGGCGTFFPHAKGVMRLAWMGMTPITRIGLGRLSTTGYTAMSIRAVSRRSTFNTGLTNQDFIIRMTDGGTPARTVDMLLTEIGRLPHLYPANDPREHLSTIRVRFDELREIDPMFDPATLTTLELEMTTAGHTTGSIYITDIELAAD